jgi:hypothetical protein
MILSVYHRKKTTSIIIACTTYHLHPLSKKRYTKIVPKHSVLSEFISIRKKNVLFASSFHFSVVERQNATRLYRFISVVGHPPHAGQHSYPVLVTRRGGQGRRLPPTPNKPSTLKLQSTNINFPKLNASPTRVRSTAFRQFTILLQFFQLQLHSTHNTPHSVQSLPHSREFLRGDHRDMYYRGERERERYRDYGHRYEFRDREREAYERERELERELERDYER